jgi:hypothetical protein
MADRLDCGEIGSELARHDGYPTTGAVGISPSVSPSFWLDPGTNPSPTNASQRFLRYQSRQITDDPISQSTAFCEVYAMDGRSTEVPAKPRRRYEASP